MYSLEFVLFVWIFSAIGGLLIGFESGIRLYKKQMNDILKAYAEDQDNYENENPHKYDDA